MYEIGNHDPWLAEQSLSQLAIKYKRLLINRAERAARNAGASPLGSCRRSGQNAGDDGPNGEDIVTIATDAGPITPAAAIAGMMTDPEYSYLFGPAKEGKGSR